MYRILLNDVLLNDQVNNDDIKNNITINKQVSEPYKPNKLDKLNRLDHLKSIVTIGNFDGLHVGHIHLLETMNHIANTTNTVNAAKDQRLRRIVITFEPLPTEYFCDKIHKSRLSRLGLLRDKVLLLQQFNLADELVIIKFNAACANLTPDEFIQNYLLLQLNIVHIVVGHDFRFGCNRIGNIDSFAKYKNKISTTIVDQFILLNKRVSSSLIRDLAKHNQLAEIRVYLGRNIQYTSRVVHGNHIGRTLGVPTINLSLGRNQPALWGIYLAYVYIDNIKYNAVASIGKNPTVSHRGVYQLEAHLLDVDLDLYGKIATIEILEFMREELKFNDMQELMLQMQTDLLQARSAFATRI